MTVKEKVIELLETIPQTRSNDRLLIAYVLKDIYKVQNTFDVADNKQISGNIYESVRRYRQKAQESNPALRPCEEILKARLVKEQSVREEMRGV